jgi:hypothetical protein
MYAPSEATRPVATEDAPPCSFPEGGVGVLLLPPPAPGALAEPGGGVGTPPGVDGDGAIAAGGGGELATGAVAGAEPPGGGRG